VIFEHLYELSDGKLNMIQSTGESVHLIWQNRTSEYLIKFCQLATKIQSNKNKTGKSKTYTKTIIRNSNVF
jgi:hypothetical protein